MNLFKLSYKRFINLLGSANSFGTTYVISISAWAGLAKNGQESPQEVLCKFGSVRLFDSALMFSVR